MKRNYRALCAVVALAIFAAMPAQAAVNDDEHECKFVHSQQGIDACTRLLTEVSWTDDRDTAWVYFNRGTDYLGQGQTAQALADLNEAIKKAPAYSDAFINRASLYVRTGQLQLAKADLDAVVTLHPDYVQSTGGGGGPYTSRYSAAVTDIAMINRARVEVLLGDLPDAVLDADTAKKHAPINPSMEGIDCWVHAVNNDQLDAALADCNDALDARPDEAAYFYYRGFVRYRMNDFSGAIKDLDQAAAKEANYESALYLRGLAKAKAGDVSGSKADIAAAIAIRSTVAAQFTGYGMTP
jgi:tetratricopeptide (TPR) repeat protein